MHAREMRTNLAKLPSPWLPPAYQPSGLDFNIDTLHWSLFRSLWRSSSSAGCPKHVPLRLAYERTYIDAIREIITDPLSSEGGNLS